ncbi:MAG: hypothetical protein IT462_06835 [Planctomycetes bacterium]|nr:hypothetical protein [Planctomycetota bacterium]
MTAPQKPIAHWPKIGEPAPSEDQFLQVQFESDLCLKRLIAAVVAPGLMIVASAITASATRSSMDPYTAFPTIEALAYAMLVASIVGGWVCTMLAVDKSHGGRAARFALGGAYAGFGVLIAGLVAAGPLGFMFALAWAVPCMFCGGLGGLLVPRTTS